MNQAQRDRLHRLRPAMGPYLTLTLVLFATMVPGLASAAALTAGGGIDSPLAIRRAAPATEPVVFGGLVLNPVACAVTGYPLLLPANALARRAGVPAQFRLGSREVRAAAPVRGP